MNFIKFVLFLTLIIQGQVSVFAQGWKSFQSQQKINDLVDTGDELLMATDAGLVVMNKTTLEKTFFNTDNSNLSNNHIQSITEAPNGNFWIGTYDVVLSRFDGTDFQDGIVPEGVDYNPLVTTLYDLKVAPNGDLWLGTTSGIFHRVGQTWTLYDEAEAGEGWDIEIDDAGEVFAASFDLHKFANGTWSNLTENTDIHGYLHADLFFNSTGDLYFVGDLEEVGRFDGEEWTALEHGLNGSEIVRISEDASGGIYFNARRDGVYKLENDIWVQQTDAQTEAFEDEIDYFYIDADDTRWMNSDIQLSVNRNNSIESTIISQHRIANNSINGLHKGANGDMFIISGNSENIARVDPDGNWSYFTLPISSEPFEKFSDILFLAEDDIWLTSNKGYYYTDGEEWIFFEEANCYSICMDSKGIIYIRATLKIIVIDTVEEMISEYNADNSPFTASYISGYGVDSADNLWIAEEETNTIQKVSTDGTWTTYTQADHPAIEKPKGDFHFDSNDNAWVPSTLGVIRFDGTAFSNPFVGNLDSMSNYRVFSIRNDAAGKLYFSHQYGVTTIDDGVWGELLIENNVPNEDNSSSSKIEFDDEGTLWWASNRYGVFTYTEETTTSVFTVLEELTTFSIYPNPARTHTSVDFTLEQSAAVEISIYNYLGQIQSSINLGQLPAGTFREAINLSSFQKGYYLIQLIINDQRTTKTLIVH